jgi:hypothetical protein
VWVLVPLCAAAAAVNEAEADDALEWEAIGDANSAEHNSPERWAAGQSLVVCSSGCQSVKAGLYDHFTIGFGNSEHLNIQDVEDPFKILFFNVALFTWLKFRRLTVQLKPKENVF